MRTGGQEENLVRLGEVVIGATLKVHSHLGPGRLEGICETCLVHELRTRGLGVESQRVLPVVYEGIVLDAAFRLDVLIENQVVLEVKAVAQLLPIHKAQLISYLKLGNYPLGYLLNFNDVHMKHGIERVSREL